MAETLLWSGDGKEATGALLIPEVLTSIVTLSQDSRPSVEERGTWEQCWEVLPGQVYREGFLPFITLISLQHLELETFLRFLESPGQG